MALQRKQTAESSAAAEDLDEVPGAHLPSELTHFLGYLLRRAFVRFSVDAAHDHVDPRKFSVLDALSYRDWLSQYDLAKELGINRTIMVSLIDRLEESGFVFRTRNQNNRRSYVLSLTDEGLRALKDMSDAIMHSDKRFTEPLDDAERQRLNELLANLAHEHEKPPSTSTGVLLGRAHHRIRKLGDEMLASTGLRIRHYAPLAGLAALGPCAQQALALHLAIAEPAAAQLVEDLVSSGLVRRGRDAHDRRRYALELSELGWQQMAAMQKIVDEIQTVASEKLGVEGEAELRALLLKLLRAEKRS